MGRPRTGRIPNFSIRIKPEAIKRAREAALRQNTTIGIWLERAIDMKINHDKPTLSEEAEKR